MSIELIIGWWIAPAVVTVASLAWAFPMRDDERQTGSMFGGLGYALGSAFRVGGAIIVSLVCWLTWALLA